jgi:hypothetical protein
MKESPVFTYSFVQCMEKYPYTWNGTYIKREVTNHAWKAISEEMKASSYFFINYWFTLD